MLAGGHSINDVDVKYGLSVMGTIHPKRILENNHCKEGDLLLFDQAVRSRDRHDGIPHEMQCLKKL